jgi:hypothetical protein
MDSCLWKCAALAACAVMIVLGTPLRALEELQVDVGVAALSGEIHGQVQTPRGGEPGTTSSHRPTLSELGIDDTGAGDFWVNVSHDRHGLYLGGRLIHLSADTTLDDTLVSQGITFPAGSAVDACIKFDWYRAGYRYHFPLDWGDETIDLYPSIGATFLDFRYTLTSPGIARVDRGYTKVGGQVGLGVTWPLKDNLSLVGQVLAPVPIPHWPSILSAQVGLKYRFLEHEDLCISGLAGIDYDWISYEDRQQVPNDIEADVGPMGVVALEVSF